MFISLSVYFLDNVCHVVCTLFPKDREKSFTIHATLLKLKQIRLDLSQSVSSTFYITLGVCNMVYTWNFCMNVHQLISFFKDNLCHQLNTVAYFSQQGMQIFHGALKTIWARIFFVISIVISFDITFNDKKPLSLMCILLSACFWTMFVIHYVLNCM